MQHLMHGYLASITYLDYQLGRLLNALDKSSMKDNTIILLWSDHGFHIGEKENWEKFAYGIKRLGYLSSFMLLGFQRWKEMSASCHVDRHLSDTL